MSRCRACNTVRTKGDPCPNADCPRNTAQATPLRAKTRPVTLAVKHGFHAANTSRTQLVSDYDLPIRARRWRAAS
jgi:hypothetical protein